jgi:hypothetical protein
MGDNIKDAELRGTVTPTARKGWAALTEEARSQGILAADYGSTCLRLSSGTLMIDRTSGFSEDEFHRARREYVKFNITDIWVIGPNSGASAEFLKRNKGSVMVMLHADRKDCRFVIDGVRYSLAGGLKYVMTGKKDSSFALPTRGVKMVTERLHRNSYRKIALRPETAAL